MSEEFRTDYPLKTEGDYVLKCLGGFDVFPRSGTRIMAVVVVERQNGTRDMKLYRWQLRTSRESGQQAWKVDLCNPSIRRIDFTQLAEKIERLRTKFGIPVG